MRRAGSTSLKVFKELRWAKGLQNLDLASVTVALSGANDANTVDPRSGMLASRNRAS